MNSASNTGRYMVLSDARRSTGSVGGGDLEHPMATELEALKLLLVDEKLNVLLEGMLNLQKKT
jgi:hypothetical protein